MNASTSPISFDLVTFPLIELDHMIELATKKWDWVTPNDVRESFPCWVDIFARRVDFYYRSTVLQLQQSLHKRFARKHGLDLYFFISEYPEFRDEYDDFMENLRTYHASTIAQMAFVADYAKQYPNLGDEFYEHIDHELGMSVISDLNATVAGYRLLTFRLFHVAYHELWFDFAIQTREEPLRKLQNMSYEDYLKTPHWRKVRACMLVTYNRTCRVSNCLYHYDTYSGEWLEELQIHHLRYTNRGRERFRDLVPVCSKHHEALHNRTVSDDEISIEVVNGPNVNAPAYKKEYAEMYRTIILGNTEDTDLPEDLPF